MTRKKYAIQNVAQAGTISTETMQQRARRSGVFRSQTGVVQFEPGIPMEAAAKAWEMALERIPTVFGRIRHVASLRDANTGLYHHAGLAQRVGDEAADGILRKSHITLFAQWLCFNLSTQREEVQQYFSGIDGNQRSIIVSWLTIEPYAAWVPAESRDVERELFYSDLGVILETFRAEHGVPSRDPDL